MQTRKLTPEQHHIMKEHGTERPGSSPLNYEKRTGRFMCAGCGAELFDSETKYESGSGWPSFTQAKPGAVATTTDTTPLTGAAATAGTTAIAAPTAAHF